MTVARQSNVLPIVIAVIFHYNHFHRHDKFIIIFIIIIIIIIYYCECILFVANQKMKTFIGEGGQAGL